MKLLDFERSPPIRARSGICGGICIWGGPLRRPGAPAVGGGGGGEGEEGGRGGWGSGGRGSEGDEEERSGSYFEF